MDALTRAAGDIVILGAGGKMGPTLAVMARRALGIAGSSARVIAVSRFASGGRRAWLEEHGVETIVCDLLDRAAVAALPDAPNVVFMAGQKFGTADAPSRTWMLNVVAPANAAERYASSRIVAFSTGNVYALTAAAGGGSRETDPLQPVGEYAASCVGRERVFEFAAATRNTACAIVRLNYAIDLRYGVLTDLALRIHGGDPVPLAMARVNVIWQGDANRIALELLPHASAPPLVMNVTGPEHLRVRDLAEALGRRLGRTPRYEGAEGDDALLSDTARMRTMCEAPATPLDTMLDWTAEWVAAGRPLLGKPTKFERRDGAF